MWLCNKHLAGASGRLTRQQNFANLGILAWAKSSPGTHLGSSCLSFPPGNCRGYQGSPLWINEGRKLNEATPSSFGRKGVFGGMSPEFLLMGAVISCWNQWLPFGLKDQNRLFLLIFRSSQSTSTPLIHSPTKGPTGPRNYNTEHSGHLGL